MGGKRDPNDREKRNNLQIRGSGKGVRKMGDRGNVNLAAWGIQPEIQNRREF